MTVERLGYVVAAIGAVVFLTSGNWPNGRENHMGEVAMYSGVAVFLAGIALSAFDLNKRRR